MLTHLCSLIKVVISALLYSENMTDWQGSLERAQSVVSSQRGWEMADEAVGTHEERGTRIGRQMLAGVGCGDWC